MVARINGLGQVNGVAADVGLSLMQLGMVTGLHAAISPSVFTFSCFARKPEECAIARRTLWISVSATTVVNIGTLIVFKRWIPAIVGQLVGLGLFALGMQAVSANESAPSEPTMKPSSKTVEGLGRVHFNPTVQPQMMKAQDHWLDIRYKDTYSRWWDVPDKVSYWR
jgi:hypothetical protein